MTLHVYNFVQKKILQITLATYIFMTQVNYIQIPEAVRNRITVNMAYHKYFQIG